MCHLPAFRSERETGGRKDERLAERGCAFPQLSQVSQLSLKNQWFHLTGVEVLELKIVSLELELVLSNLGKSKAEIRNSFQVYRLVGLHRGQGVSRMLQGITLMF